MQPTWQRDTLLFSCKRPQHTRNTLWTCLQSLRPNRKATNSTRVWYPHVHVLVSFPLPPQASFPSTSPPPLPCKSSPSLHSTSLPPLPSGCALLDIRKMDHTFYFAGNFVCQIRYKDISTILLWNQWFKARALISPATYFIFLKVCYQRCCTL